MDALAPLHGPRIITALGTLAVAAACLVAPLLMPAPASAQTVVVEQITARHQDARLVKLIDAEYPWSIAWLPDGAMLVTEKRSGRLLRVRDGEATEIAGVPEHHSFADRGQGGLLDVAVHPEFDRNPWIYLTYSKGDDNATATAMARGRLVGDALTDVQELFVQNQENWPGRQYGSRLLFLPDGTLLMSVGDRYALRDSAQDLRYHAGKILRFNDDGTTPDDNPFAQRDDALPEIYSYGHRNIQGLTLHPETGDVWAVDHGARGGDRLDLIEPGHNYGWPVVTVTHHYHDDREPVGEARARPDVVPPVHQFAPRVPPSGLAVIHGGRYPRWEGNFLVGSLETEHIRRMLVEFGGILHQPVGEGPTMLIETESDGDEVFVEGWFVAHQEELVRQRIGRIRDVRMGPDDLIYIATDEADGGVYRIDPIEPDEADD